MSVVAATVKAVAPGTSIRAGAPLPDGLPDSSARTTRSVMAMATAAMGRLTQKIACQLRCSVSRPPRSGPAAAAPPLAAPHMPKAVPRSLPWYEEIRRAGVVANMAAPPTPCTTRAAINTPASGASPQTSEARPKSPRP